MTRTMYDGVTVAHLPTGAPLYAGYVDGRYANVTALRKRFPKARIVEIAVLASTDAGQVLDVETGDATPAQAPGWVVSRRHAGVDPTVYCNSSTWPAVRAAFRNAGIAEPHYWIAQYDNKATIPTGAVAKQFQNDPGWDKSVVADYWPGIDPKPVPEDTMTLTSADLAALSKLIDERIAAAGPAIARAVAQTDGLYPAPADRVDKVNRYWTLESFVTDIDGIVRGLADKGVGK
ncbi:hypothetical protein [Streptantibioticus silvisoli]|uniref:Uncharacterized protein n=1 Tax=Streptantibioticus silvisoli TaxID=2705255 RepID=A0ABT6W4M6_9ACTN|nr:hypothetical protein [Streptantibioticus silvisoli]MDI5965708.1 hypothetical protein [Streptantibioticus silvisoli]